MKNMEIKITLPYKIKEEKPKKIKIDVAGRRVRVKSLISKDDKRAVITELKTTLENILNGGDEDFNDWKVT